MNKNPFEQSPFEQSHPFGSPDGQAPTNPFSAQGDNETKEASPVTSPKTSTPNWPVIAAVAAVVLAVVVCGVLFAKDRKNDAAQAEKDVLTEIAVEECEPDALREVSKYFGVNLESDDLDFTTTSINSVERSGDRRVTIDASGNYSGVFASSNAEVTYRCTLAFSPQGSGKDLTVTNVEQTSFMMDGPDFESLTYIDEAIEEQQAEAEAEAEREREEEERRREQKAEQERRERQEEQERRERQAEQERREQQAEQERQAEREQRQQLQRQQQQQQRQQQQQQQQQQQAPAPAAPQSNGMEWATIGPYGGFMGCSQAQGMWPSNSTECYQGGDGNYYFNGMRQARR